MVVGWWWVASRGARECHALQRLHQLRFPSSSLPDSWGNLAPVPSSPSFHFLILRPHSGERWQATVTGLPDFQLIQTEAQRWLQTRFNCGRIYRT